MKKVLIIVVFILVVSLSFNIWLAQQKDISAQNTENQLQAQTPPEVVEETVYTIKDDDYRNKMRQFIMNISSYGKERNEKFSVITNNGTEIYRFLPEDNRGFYEQFLTSIDGICIEEFHFGMDMQDNTPTSVETQEYFLENVKLPQKEGVSILNIDYCKGKNIALSYQKSAELGFINYATEHRDLTNIPNKINQYAGENNSNVDDLANAKNFLILLNPEEFADKEDFINSMAATNYDVLIIDLFSYDEILTSEDVQLLKKKSNGGTRKVISYMSIGEAEDYRHYWNSAWDKQLPDWIEAENPDWEGCYKVKYWEDDWQGLIFGTEDAYLDTIIKADFDGVFLDVIDAYMYFEEN